MKLTRKETVAVDCVYAVKCDVCGMVHYNIMEIQEYTTISFTAGYNTVFCDGTKYKCDVCQRCLKKLLGKYLRVTNSDF